MEETKNTSNLDNFDYKHYEPDGYDARWLIYKVIHQAALDYVYLLYPKNTEQEKILASAEMFLFDDSYTVRWGEEHEETTLKEMLVMLNEPPSTDEPADQHHISDSAVSRRYSASHQHKPIDIDAMRKAIKKQAYEHNNIDGKTKQGSQFKFDFLGLEEEYER